MADGIRIKIGLDGVQQVQAGAAAAAQSLGQVGASAGRTGQQTAQLSAQIQDFFVQVQAGGNPLTALIQQGSQLSAVYGGVGNAFRAVTGLLTPAVVAIGGLAAGVGALALAYKQGSAEADAYNRALILTGNIAGTTSGQLKEMAKAQAAVAGTQGQAAAVLAQLAASGQVAASELGKAASAAIRLERAGGPAAEETAKKFAELGKSPLQAVVRLNEAENFLTVSVYKQIRALEIQGKQAEAAAVAQKAYADALEGRGGQLEQRLGSIERGWLSVRDQAKKAWDAMLDIGRESTLEERLKKTGQQIEQQRQRLAGLNAAPQAGNLALTGGAGARSTDGNVGALLNLQRAQSTTLLRRTESAIAARADAILVQQTIEQQAKSLEQQAARAQAAYAVLAAKIKGDIEQIQSALKQGLSSPIEAIEREGGKRGDLLKAELSLLQQQYAVAKDTVGGQAQAITLLGQISAKRIDIANEEIATQNKVKEAIYATKKAAAEFYRQEQEEGERAIADDKLKNRDTFNAKFDQASDYAQSIDDANAALELQTRLIGANDQARAVAIERLRIEQEEARKLLEIQRTEGLLPEQRDKLNEKVSEAAVRARGAAEAKAYLEEYQRIYDDLRSGLTDALIEGGKSARDYLRSLFRNLVLQPLLRPLVSPVAGFIANATAGTSFADTGAAGGASGTFGQIGTAANLYSAGQKLYEGFASGFAEIGTAAKGAYFSMFESGAVGSANAAQIAAASGEAGYYGSAASGAYSTAAGTSANASLVSNVASTAAGVAVGVMAGRALSGGYSAIGGNSGNTAVNVGTAIGAIWGPIGAAVGGIIGGVVNRAFGRKAPEVEGRSIEGSITGGDFAGSAITSILEKGGLFRSDKRSTESQAITGDLDKALDEGAKSLVTLATKYGDALGLPVTALGNVTAAIKVKITDDAAENTKAIADALGQYADALLGTFADQIEPFRKSGETVAQTIERVGGALLGVNDVLTTLGLTALSTSLDGGKAALALTDLFGGASNFAQSAGSYYQKFYSEAERADRATAQITKTLAEFGIQAPTTRDAYRSLVEAQDLTTEGGQKAFVALLSLADAFDAVQTASDGAAEAAKRQADETAANNKRLQDAIGSNLGKFQTPGQQTDSAYQRIAAQLADAGVQTTASVLRGISKEAILAFAEAFVSLDTNSTEAKTAIVEAAGALADLKDSAAAAAQELADRLQSAIDSNIGGFLSAADNRQYQAGRISQSLAGFGVNFSADQLLAASKQQIFDFARTFVGLADVSMEAKIAVVEAAGALGALVDAANEAARQDAIKGLQTQIEAFNKQFGDLTVLDDVETLSQAFVRNRTELQGLEEGFASLMGTVGKTVQETLRDVIESQRAIVAYRSGSLADSITDARLRSQAPAERIASLRNTEAGLFAQLGTAADPVAIAQKLQSVILRRISEESALRQSAFDAEAKLAEQARDAQITSLRTQIDAFERMRQLAQEIGQFTGSLRFSDLSPLNYTDQLGSARSLFETTLAKAQGGDQFAQGNLTGNARAYLDEARAYFASSAEYAAIFAQVTGALDSLASTAADPQLEALQSQLAALEALQITAQTAQDTAAEELAALTSIDNALAVREAAATAAVDRQVELARQQLEEMRNAVAELKAQLEVAREAYKQLIAQLERLNETTEQGVNVDDLEGARP